MIIETYTVSTVFSSLCSNGKIFQQIGCHAHLVISKHFLHHFHTHTLSLTADLWYSGLKCHPV